MLAAASKRVEAGGWKNIELINEDITAFEYPDAVAGIIAVGSFGYITRLEEVIDKASRALTPSGRMVILDGKQPDNWPSWMFKVFVWLFRPFQLSLDYFHGHPWEVVPRFFLETTFEQRYGGLMYISAGTAPSAG